jgi:phage repressor protein C with HTH and peptisase S24 domain
MGTIKRVKKVINWLIFKEFASNERELSELLGYTKSSFSQLVNGKVPLSDNFIDKLCSLDPNINSVWITTGEGNMFLDTSIVSELQHEQQEKHNLRALPLIPTTAFAGYGTLAYEDLIVEDYYIIREFCNADFLLRVKGDSMAPRFKSGDIIACKKIDEITFWQWHCIYAICTKSQGVLIKRVEKGTDSESLCLVSENPKYAPFQLPKDDILAVALVLGAIIIE